MSKLTFCNQCNKSKSNFFVKVVFFRNVTFFLRRYSKLEYDHARTLWMSGIRHVSDLEASEADYESQFSMMVEQEVERRLFQEKVLKAESEFQEKELVKMEREREIAALKRQHEREIYMLKRKLHESSISKKSSLNETSSTLSGDQDQFGSLTVSIPGFILSGIGSNSHVEYQVEIKTNGKF